MAMEIGAALWGLGIQAADSELESGGFVIEKTRHIGCQWGYRTLKWDPRSPVFELARASGLTVGDFQDLILVNQVGQRFWNELDDSAAFLNACLGPNGNLGKGGNANGGGPIWAIFDADGAARENWEVAPPYVDPEGYCFQADTLDVLDVRGKT